MASRFATVSKDEILAVKETKFGLLVFIGR